MYCDCSMQQPRQTALLEIQSKPCNKVTEGVIEICRINGLTVLMGWPYYWGSRIGGVTVLMGWPY